MNGSCENSRGIARTALEERLLAGLKDRLMAPEVAAEAMRAYVEETNRLNRERRSSGVSDRTALAGIEKKIKEIVTVIEDGGYTRGLTDRLRELEARQDELTERLSGTPVILPDIHPNVAGIYRRKVERLAEALKHPQERDEAAAAIRVSSSALLSRLAPGAGRSTPPSTATSAPSSNGRRRRIKRTNPTLRRAECRSQWLRGLDLNQRPSGYESCLKTFALLRTNTK